MRPFSPRGKPNQLSAFMVARMDGENYGKVVSYEIPTTQVAPSPAQAASLVQSDRDISEQFTLLDRAVLGHPAATCRLIPVGDVDPLRASGLRRRPGRRAIPAAAIRRARIRRTARARRLRGPATTITTVDQADPSACAARGPDRPRATGEPEEPDATTTTTRRRRPRRAPPPPSVQRQPSCSTQAAARARRGRRGPRRRRSGRVPGARQQAKGLVDQANRKRPPAADAAAPPADHRRPGPAGLYRDPAGLLLSRSVNSSRVERYRWAAPG